MDRDDREKLRFEPSEKHTKPWQSGRKGTLCPPPEELSLLEAARLLRKAERVGSKRYNVHKGKAYCAQAHREGRWHGYPVAWSEVPPSLKNTWRKEGLVKRRDMKEDR